MHAYLLVGNELEEHITEFVAKRSARRMDFELKTVKDARSITSFVSASFTEPTVLVVTGIEDASEVAQNAFLKTLEESAGALVFLLVAKKEEGVIPTIQSRCQIIRVASANTTVSKDVVTFLSASSGEKLKILSKITYRSDAIAFMTEVSHALKKEMLDDHFHISVLKAAQECVAALNANANVTGATTLFVMKSTLTSDK